MRITNVRINGIENPVGFTYDGLSCSWNVRETESKKAKNIVIEVSLSESFEEILYKKEGSDLNQAGELLNISLKPRTIYYYHITVTGDHGDSAVSEVYTFETGKMDEVWHAEWIATAKEDTFHPMFTKTFSVKGEVKRARLYLTGVGLFETYLNGEKVGKEYLTPYINDYEQNIQVITFDVKNHLVNADNTLEIMLGKGWYMGVFGLELHAENYGNRMAAIAELHVEYADGSEMIIGTDESWTYTGSDVEDSGIYFGEILNRKLWNGKENVSKRVDVIAEPEKAEVELPEYPDGKMILPAGSYDFSYRPLRDFLKPYGRHTTLGRLSGDPKAIEILEKYTPVLAGIALSGDPEMAVNSLEEISHIGFLPFDPEQLETAIKEIGEVTYESIYF